MLLPPLRPQNKRLHKPRTTDQRHIRQDRRIQRELASTLAKNAKKTESIWNHTTTDHEEGEQLEERRNVGESSCNSGDGTDQRVQSLMFMMIILLHTKLNSRHSRRRHTMNAILKRRNKSYST